MVTLQFVVAQRRFGGGFVLQLLSTAPKLVHDGALVGADGIQAADQVFESTTNANGRLPVKPSTICSYCHSNIMCLAMDIDHQIDGGRSQVANR